MSFIVGLFGSNLRLSFPTKRMRPDRLSSTMYPRSGTASTGWGFDDIVFSIALCGSPIAPTDVLLLLDTFSLLTSSSRCKTVTATLLVCTEAVTNGQLAGVVEWRGRGRGRGRGDEEGGRGEMRRGGRGGKTDVEKCHGEVRRATRGEVFNLPHPPEHAPTRQVSTVKKQKETQVKVTFWVGDIADRIQRSKN